MSASDDPRIETLRLSAYSVPTETDGVRRPESDGTATWDSTGVLVVEAGGGGRTGVGYAYAASGAALVAARDLLAPVVLGGSALRPAAVWTAMTGAARNAGRAGVVAGALSAIDIALHDLQARLLDVSLLELLGANRSHVMAYGSGGFTDYDTETLEHQLAAWAEEGLRAVKMKIGSDPAADPRRIREARQAIGPDIELFADANGAYSPKAALGVASMLAGVDVRWFEEPVSSDDLPGLRIVREASPAGMDIAAGEYGYSPQYFAAMLGAGAVDVIQADATRCGGVTGFRSAAHQAAALGRPLSAHTSPAIHATLGAALPGVVHVEYFHDHVLIERRFFDGNPRVVDGDLTPDASAPGLGLSLRRSDIVEYLIGEWRSA